MAKSYSEQEKLLDDAEDHLSGNPTMCCYYCGSTDRSSGPLYARDLVCSRCCNPWLPVTRYWHRMRQEDLLKELEAFVTNGVLRTEANG
jgi:hypothetical protein